MCVPSNINQSTIYSEKASFSRLNSKMPEVHKKIKHAFKTVNQCGVTALYRFSCVMYARHTSQFSYLKWMFLSLNECVLYH